MSLFGCNFKCNCTALAIVAGIIIGVVSAFLQITGVITVTPVFLWVTFGIAVVYLGALVGSVILADRSNGCRCVCSALNTILTGLVGTFLLSLVLLAVGITATSVLSAILVGLLLLFFTMTIISSACFVRYASCCAD